MRPFVEEKKKGKTTGLEGWEGPTCERVNEDRWMMILR